jgi:hypothetical protein
MQNTSSNPTTLIHILDEMTKLSLGDASECFIVPEMLTTFGRQQSQPQAAPLAGGSASAMAHRGAEFAAELDRMPILPGSPATAGNASKGGPGTVPPPPSPCIFSQ